MKKKLMSAVFGGLITLQSMGSAFAMREFNPSVEWQNFYDHAVAEDVRSGVELDTSGSWLRKGNYLAHMIKNVRFDDLDRQDNNFYSRINIRVYLLIQAIEKYCDVVYGHRFARCRPSLVMEAQENGTHFVKAPTAYYHDSEPGNNGKKALATLYQKLAMTCANHVSVPTNVDIEFGLMPGIRSNGYRGVVQVRDALSGFLLSFVQQDFSRSSLLHSENLKQQVMRIRHELVSILGECQADDLSTQV